MSQTFLSSDLHHLLANAKVISRIPKGGKISLRGSQLHIDTQWALASVVRWFYSDSRERTLTFIRDIIVKMMGLYEQHMNTKDTTSSWPSVLCGELLDTLFSCVEGLGNLRVTYTNDFQTTAQLDSLITSIHQFISVHKN